MRLNQLTDMIRLQSRINIPMILSLSTHRHTSLTAMDTHLPPGSKSPYSRLWAGSSQRLLFNLHLTTDPISMLDYADSL
jgi:hypothetical protein